MIDRAETYNSPGYGAFCSTCGSYLILTADPNHKSWKFIPESRYAKSKKGRWELTDDPITDDDARAEALLISSGQKVCCRCKEDGQRRKPGSGRPGVGPHEELIPVNGESE